MQVYDKPFIYTLSHIITGFITVWYPLLGLLFLAYQFLQLTFNIRFFLFSLEIKKGNNPLHTARKIAEFAAGYLAGFLARSRIRSRDPLGIEKIMD
jgi:hypothetical protein